MELISYLKPILLAGGFLFILVGLNILIAEQPSYTEQLSGLFQLMTIIFYLYLVLLFLSVLITGLQALLGLAEKKKA